MGTPTFIINNVIKYMAEAIYVKVSENDQILLGDFVENLVTFSE